MCWRTEGTFTTARCCFDVLVILAPDIKLQTYLLTYFNPECMIVDNEAMMMMMKMMTCNGSMRTAASIAVNKHSSSHRTLDITDVETTLTKHCTLLISHLH